MPDQKMETVLKEIKKLTDACYGNEKYWKVKEMELLPPASESDIKALSKDLPFPLPPSYIEFLKLHNGCMYFWPKMYLMGAKGETRKIIIDELQDAEEYQTQRIFERIKLEKSRLEEKKEIKKAEDLIKFLLDDEKQLGQEKHSAKELTPKLIEYYETPTKNQKPLFLPHHLVFGTGKNGTFWVFNEKHKNKDGEYAVIDYSYDVGINEEYQDFGAFLSSTLKDLQERVEKKKYVLES
jgi:hypothetical protein